MSHHLQNAKIEITAGTIVKGVIILLLFWILFLVKDLVLVVLAAVVLASSIEPLTKWCIKKRIRRLPAVILIYIILALFLAGIFFFFLPLVLTEASTYLKSLPENISLSDLWNPIQESGVAIDNGIDHVLSPDFSVKEAVSGLQQIIAGTGEGVLKTASVIFGGVLSLVLIVVLSFYLAVQEDGVGNFLRIITPRKAEKYVIDLWRRSQIKIGFWLQGQLLLSILIGILVYLGLTVLGIKHALLLATLAMIFEIIPIFGPILAAIPGIVVGVVDGGVTIGLVVAGLYIVIQQFENHLIYPLVVKKIVGVSPIVVILALVIGAKLAGFLGALLAVPLASVLMEYINDVERRRMTHHTSEIQA